MLLPSPKHLLKCSHFWGKDPSSRFSLNPCSPLSARPSVASEGWLHPVFFTGLCPSQGRFQTWLVLSTPGMEHRSQSGSPANFFNQLSKQPCPYSGFGSSSGSDPFSFTQQLFIEGLLCARHCSEHFVCIITLHLYHFQENCMKEALLVSSFYR